MKSNTLKLQKETFSLTELIFEAVADMKSQLSSNQVRVDVVYNDSSDRDYQNNREEHTHDNSGNKVLHPDDNPPPVLVDADKTRIMQVISNPLTRQSNLQEVER